MTWHRPWFCFYLHYGSHLPHDVEAMVPIHAECEAACGALYARAEKSKNAKDGGADRR